MRLAATTKVYEFSDESGYSFTVTATLAPSRGWSAEVTMRANLGLISGEDAVEHLGHSAKAFLRQLEAKPKHQQRRKR